MPAAIWPHSCFIQQTFYSDIMIQSLTAYYWLAPTAGNSKLNSFPLGRSLHQQAVTVKHNQLSFFCFLKVAHSVKRLPKCSISIGPAVLHFCCINFVEVAFQFSFRTGLIASVSALVTYSEDFIQAICEVRKNQLLKGLKHYCDLMRAKRNCIMYFKSLPNISRIFEPKLVQFGFIVLQLLLTESERKSFFFFQVKIKIARVLREHCMHSWTWVALHLDRRIFKKCFL